MTDLAFGGGRFALGFAAAFWYIGDCSVRLWEVGFWIRWAGLGIPVLFRFRGFRIVLRELGFVHTALTVDLHCKFHSLFARRVSCSQMSSIFVNSSFSGFKGVTLGWLQYVIVEHTLLVCAELPPTWLFEYESRANILCKAVSCLRSDNIGGATSYPVS